MNAFEGIGLSVEALGGLERTKLVQITRELMPICGPGFIQGAYEFNPQTGSYTIPAETFRTGMKMASETSPNEDLTLYIQQKYTEHQAQETVKNARSLATTLQGQEQAHLETLTSQATTIESASSLQTILDIRKFMDSSSDPVKTRLAEIINHVTSLQDISALTEEVSRLKEGEAGGGIDTPATPAAISKDIVVTPVMPEDMYESVCVTFARLSDKGPVELQKLLTQPDRNRISQTDKHNHSDEYMLGLVRAGDSSTLDFEASLQPILSSLGLDHIDAAEVMETVKNIMPEKDGEFFNEQWREGVDIGTEQNPRDSIIGVDTNGVRRVFIPIPEHDQCLVFVIGGPRTKEEGTAIRLRYANIFSRSRMEKTKFGFEKALNRWWPKDSAAS